MRGQGRYILVIDWEKERDINSGRKNEIEDNRIERRETNGRVRKGRVSKRKKRWEGEDGKG